jgi:fatty-acid peroxygenase
VEILNVIRPTVATAWFVAYSAHALERNPALRPGLASEDPVLTAAYTFVAQGGGAPESGHRCQGEPGVVMMLEVLLPRLARLEYDVPASLSRMPARPRSGMVLRPAA